MHIQRPFSASAWLAITLSLGLCSAAAHGQRYPAEWNTWGSQEAVARAGELARAGDAAGAGEFVGWLISERLADLEAARQLSPSGGVRHWRLMTYDLAKLLSPETKRLWAERLHAVYTAPDAIMNLKGRDVEMLAGAMRNLGAKDLASSFTAAWSALMEPTAPPRDLVKLVPQKMASQALTKAQKAAWLAAHDAAWTAEHTAQPFAFRDLEALSRAWKHVLDWTKAQEWARRAYTAALGTEAAPKSPELHTLGPLAHLMDDMALSHRRQSHPLYAQALARLAAEGKLYTTRMGKLSNTGWQRRKLGYMLRTPEDRALVEAELVGPDGLPRLEVARILSEAYRRDSRLEQWHAFLDRTLSNGGASPDVRALWMMAKADARCHYGGSFCPYRGEAMMEDAIATAASPDVRQIGIWTLVGFHRRAYAGGSGPQPWERVAKYFVDDPEQYEEMRRELEKVYQAWYEASLGMLRGTAEMYERKAAEAEARGDEKLRRACLKQAEIYRRSEQRLLETGRTWYPPSPTESDQSGSTAEGG